MRNIVYMDTKKLPIAVKIISKKLCLNHTFFPKSEGKKLTLKDIWQLQDSPLIDELMVCFDYNSLYGIQRDKNGIRLPIVNFTGWYNVKIFTIADLREADLEEGETLPVEKERPGFTLL